MSYRDHVGGIIPITLAQEGCLAAIKKGEGRRVEVRS
jgi:hypothetical protein